jgi:aspartyl-tRNA(Asn)/glutamyl-tRNA(Gln) amidotransferase subunit A
MSDIAMLSLAEVSALLKERKVSPVELVDAVLERTAKYQSELNAYITLLDEDARAEARKMESEIVKGQKSPLHGVPIALKDLFYTKGVLTTAGSELLSDFIPEYDGTVTERLKKAGAIIMGKTNTHEWAFGPTTEDSYYGPSKNPWDSTRITGGSSGGSGVAVATGMAYMAMGSDTGGSIRIPSSMCGVVGFKPSFGLVSLYGVVPLSFNLDHPGPLARSVMDAALTMDIIAGYDEKDPCPGSYKGEVPKFAESLKGVDSLKGMVIGVPVNFYFDKTDFEVEKLVREAIKSLEDLGAEIREIEIPALESVPSASTTVLFAEAAYAHKDRFAAHADAYRPDVRARLENANRLTAVEYIEALKERERIRSAWENALKEVNVVAAPTLPITAYKIGSSKVVTRGKEEPAREMCVRHTRLANMTGGPAASVPCGFSSEGLPVGLMIMGSNLDDLTVMKVSYAFEKNNPFKFPNQ